MPILNHNDLKKVEEYQTFVRTSPYANATQDLAWEKVKEGWVGEQVYLEENGQIIAAMSLIIRRVFAGFSLMYAPRAPICDLHDTALVQRLMALIQHGNHEDHQIDHRHSGSGSLRGPRDSDVRHTPAGGADVFSLCAQIPCVKRVDFLPAVRTLRQTKLFHKQASILMAKRYYQ